jgi:hypothetical protein
MPMTRILVRVLATLCVSSVLGAAAAVGPSPIRISPEWSHNVGVLKTYTGVQVCPEPPLRRGNPIHDKLFSALRDFKGDYDRLQPWLVYPKLAIAELKPPTGGRTYWDFALMDQIAADFMEASAGRPVIFNLGAMPFWMLKTSTPSAIPSDPDAIDWAAYAHGRLRASTIALFAAYEARLAGWYVNGGFRDEYGSWHPSNHHYRIAYWEVLNEPDLEESITPEEYTRLYDAVVDAVRKVAPSMRFAGPAVSDPTDPAFLAYFLDPKNHRPGIPIDLVSYHFYSQSESDDTSELADREIFEQADNFITSVRYIDAIRERFSPTTRTAVDELGSMLPGALAPHLIKPIPQEYWNLSGAMWAYVFGHLAVEGINVVDAAELIDYPGQVASTTLVKWDTGEPNARYWVAKLMRDNFRPGDTVVQPLPPAQELDGPNPGIQVYAQAFITPRGERKLLLVNKRNWPVDVLVPGASGGRIETASESGPPTKRYVDGETIRLPPLAVAVLTLNRRKAGA